MPSTRRRSTLGSTRARALGARASNVYSSTSKPCARRVRSAPSMTLAKNHLLIHGLISPWINRWFFANVIEGAERTLRAHGFDVLLYTFDARAPSARARVDPSVLRRRVDGILVVGLPLAREEIDALVHLGYPLVCIGWGGYGQVTVRLDDRATAIDATRHLIGLGHTRIAHITGAPDDVAPWSPPVERSAGWRAALVEAGVVVDPALEVYGHFDVEGGRAATLELLADVTAVFAASDEMAMGAILALRASGRRVPEDVSVIGVDGHDLGELVGLTTMAQPANEQGAAAAEIVLDMIGGASPPPELIYPTVLVERTSTGPA